jgi:curved DNA-binding protein CbpA
MDVAMGHTGSAPQGGVDLDPYKTLQVHPTAPRRLIDEAYWWLATRVTGVSARAEHTIQALNDAYTLLGNETLRKAYNLEHRLDEMRQPRVHEVRGGFGSFLGLGAPPRLTCDFEDYYHLLGIDTEAAGGVVELAAAIQSQRSAGRTVQHAFMRELVAEAYRVLSHPQLRAQYDVATGIATQAERMSVVVPPPAPVRVVEPVVAPPLPERKAAGTNGDSNGNGHGNGSHGVTNGHDEAAREPAAAMEYRDVREPDIAIAELHEPEETPAAELAATEDEESVANAVVEAPVLEVETAAHAPTGEAPAADQAPVTAPDPEPMGPLHDAHPSGDGPVVSEAEAPAEQPVVLRPEPTMPPPAPFPAEEAFECAAAALRDDRAVASNGAPTAVPSSAPPVPKLGATPAPAPVARPEEAANGNKKGLFARLMAAKERTENAAPPAPKPPTILEQEVDRLRTLRAEPPVRKPPVVAPPPAAASNVMPAALTFVGGSRDGERVTLQHAGVAANALVVFTIGSGGTCDIVLPDEDGRILPEHARLWHMGERWVFRQMDGGHSSINGETPALPLLVLEDGDLIEIAGGQRLRFDRL